MPVTRGTRFDLRSALVVGLAGVVVAVALVVGVLWLTRPGRDVEFRLGDPDFRDMRADRISNEIADRGPVLFGDVAGGDLDIYLQHVTDDPNSGWLAFEARRVGQSRDCFFEWKSEADLFTNSCDPEDTVDACGTGLRHFQVAVVDGDIRVDLNKLRSNNHDRSGPCSSEPVTGGEP